MKIVGDGLYLRLMTAEDTGLIVKWRNNIRVRSNFIFQEIFTSEMHENWIRTKVDTGEVVQFIICEENDRPVGSVYFRDIDEKCRHAEYGIFIGEDDAVGKGYGSKTCKLACDWAFAERGWHKISLRLLAENTIAYKSYAAAGFVEEGHMKDEVFLMDGKYHDVIFMGLINPAENK